VSQSFSSLTKKQDDRTLIVDFLNLAFRWKHQGRSDYRYDILKTVESLAQSYKCGNIIITADWGSSTYRKELLPEYKGNRKALREKQTEEEAAAFQEFIIEYEEALKVASEKYKVFRYKGVEADDIAAHLVAYKDDYNLGTIWLISSDRDWDLLINEEVNRFSYVTRKEVTIDTWYEHYDVSPEQYISYKCLTGDAGDNVPGIAGIGPKRAAGLLEMYDSAMDIYDYIPLPGKAKYIQELNANPNTLLLNYELMDLLTYCDEAIGPENILDIEEIFNADQL
jgi:5'-3' exonuclease